MITLATATPAKFPDAVERATGVHPPLPPFLAELFERPEHFEVASPDLVTSPAGSGPSTAAELGLGCCCPDRQRSGRAGAWFHRSPL